MSTRTTLQFPGIPKSSSMPQHDLWELGTNNPAGQLLKAAGALHGKYFTAVVIFFKQEQICSQPNLFSSERLVSLSFAARSFMVVVLVKLVRHQLGPRATKQSIHSMVVTAHEIFSASSDIFHCHTMHLKGADCLRLENVTWTLD